MFTMKHRLFWFVAIASKIITFLKKEWKQIHYFCINTTEM